MAAGDGHHQADQSGAVLRLGARRLRIVDADIENWLSAEREKAGAVNEYNIAQILLAVPENASESEVQAAQARAADIAQRARRGEDFAALAKTYSQAFDKGSNGGEMGLRAAERYPDLFVNATRNLRVGAISAVVQSGAGFHILKVIERRQGQATLIGLLVMGVLALAVVAAVVAAPATPAAACACWRRSSPTPTCRRSTTTTNPSPSTTITCSRPLRCSTHPLRARAR